MSTQTSPPVHVESVVRQAYEELLSLAARRAEIIRRIHTIKRTISGLTELFGKEIVTGELAELVKVNNRPRYRETGFTDACRNTLIRARRPLSRHEVCQTIQKTDPALIAHHKNPLASVTSVLDRLARYGEVKTVARDHGPRSYQWAVESMEDAGAC
ncbi:MAG: hypothetical protein JOY93_12175 [Acidobacteriales bacterium]|nr:hypothetical protein [Terriglobales bacterium]